MAEGFHIPLSPWCERANGRIKELESEVERLQGQFSLAYLLLMEERTRDLSDLLDSEASGKPYDADDEEYK